MSDIVYVKSSIEYAVSCNRAVESVARERKFLMAAEGFPPEQVF